MKYLKTYEQLQSFYGGKDSKWLIVTKDDKYAISLNKNFNNTLKDPKLFPTDIISNDINFFLFNDKPVVYLELLNNYESKEVAEKYYTHKGSLDTMQFVPRILNSILERDGFKLIFDEPYDKPNMYKIIELQQGFQVKGKAGFDI